MTRGAADRKFKRPFGATTAAPSHSITRDALIGAVPAAAISDWRHVAVSLRAGEALDYSWGVGQLSPYQLYGEWSCCRGPV
jgi:hypothetical protein